MAKKTTQREELPRPKLVKSREEVKSLLEERIEKGRELTKSDIQNPESLKKAEAEEKKWADYNEQLLEAVFSNAKFAEEFKHSRYGSSVIFGDQSFWEDVADFHEDMERQITSLESIAERINLIDESAENVSNEHTPVKVLGGQQNLDRGVSKSAVFVVHGHDEELKNSVTTLLLKLKVRPVVLAEEVNAGRTVIEKFEHFANEASFAVVLLTPDDTGKKVESSGDLEPRARQNVILELGYFMGKLGRPNICALLSENVSRPSDIAGVVYVPVDGASAWHYSLAKELKEAGYDVDLNNI